MKASTAAELAGFDMLLTSDKGIRYQQNLAGRGITLVVLSTNNWNHIRDHAVAILSAIDCAAPGSYQAIDLPRPPLLRRPRAL